MSGSYPPARTHEAIDLAVAGLVSNRYGIFSRDEATRLGATRYMIEWRLESGRWEQLSRGIYRLAGVPSSWRQSVFAETLGWGKETHASHRSAARLYTLPGFSIGRVELTVPRGRRRRSSQSIVHEVISLPAGDRAMVDAIPVTSPVRTLIDIAGVVEAEIVEEALDDALRRRLVSLPRMRRRVDELAGPGRPGSALMRRLIAAREYAAEVPQSVFETRLLRVFKRCGLPQPAIQHEICVNGRFVARVDFAYPKLRLAIEADGYRWHSSRARWRADLERRNRLTALGWRVVHVTWEDLSRPPDELLRLISFPR